MRLSTALPLFSALSGAALLSVGAATIGARAIEQSTQRAVTAQLELEGFEWADVSTDGLNVVLIGTAPNEAAQLAAQRAAGHVVDSARVINVMTIEQQEEIPAPKFSIEILRNDQGISLIGLVPTSWDKEDFIDDVKKAGSTGSVVDLLGQADYALPDNWDETMRYGINAIKRLPRSKISLSTNRISVTALADSLQQKANFERVLRSSAPDDVQTLIKITAPRPVITPFTARFVMDDNGSRFDACTAETPQGQARIVAAARAMDAADPGCVIGLGAPSTQWANAVETGMRAVSKLGGGSITFSDADVTLIGLEGSVQKDFDRVAADLEKDLPDSFSLAATWTPPKNTDKTEENVPELVILRTPEGQVQLRGFISDERSRAATQALAGAEFGSHAVYSSMRVDTSLPAGWSTQAMTSIDVLSKLNQGSITVQEGQISVKGQTGDPRAKAEITRLLSSRLGEGQTYDIAVDYVRKLDPLLNLPTPEKCVADANSAISSGKIVFAPGSTDVDASANDTLDRIAKALEQCEDMSMEIGGHTDSQGRETMNAELSQARADSVLEALLTRRVLGVKFSAKGYGETQPISDNGTAAGREDNRRIEFKLTGQPSAADSSENEANNE